MIRVAEGFFSFSFEVFFEIRSKRSLISREPCHLVHTTVQSPDVIPLLALSRICVTMAADDNASPIKTATANGAREGRSAA